MKEQEEEKIYSFGPIWLTVGLTGLFFLMMTYLLRPFIPATEPWIVWLGSAYTSSVIAGTFFLAINLFFVVFTDKEHKRRTALANQKS